MQDGLWVLHFRPYVLTHRYMLCPSGMNLQQTTINAMRVGDRVLYRRPMVNIQLPIQPKMAGLQPTYRLEPKELQAMVDKFTRDSQGGVWDPHNQPRLLGPQLQARVR